MPDFAPSSADTLHDPPDEALLAAARRDGDAEAFLALAARHHRALRALAGCWPGGAHDAERDVAGAWRAVLMRGGAAGAASGAVPPPPVRARVAREVVAAAVGRTRAALEPAPSWPLDAGRFFAAGHALWPGEWADPPRPWGASAARRLGQRDIPPLLARSVRELGIAPAAVVTLCDVHGWAVAECAAALDRSDAEVRAFRSAGREALRAMLEAEVDSR